jgi:hypothetical protein
MLATGGAKSVGYFAIFSENNSHLIGEGGDGRSQYENGEEGSAYPEGGFRVEG